MYTTECLDAYFIAMIGTQQADIHPVIFEL